MSDGLTDCARSNRIAGATSQLLDAQLDFLVKPTKEGLEKIYEFCSNLEMCPGGYWGESGVSMARRVSQHYQERFGREITEAKPGVQDVAVLLGNIRQTYQLEFLAGIITRRTIKEGEQYWEELNRRIDELRGKISLQQAEALGKAPIDTKTIEDIFSSVNFNFP